MTVTPLKDRLLVKYGESKKATESGLLLAESAQKKPTYCQIIKTGPEVENKDLAAGINVMTVGYAGTDIKIDGKEFSIVKESDIIAIVEENFTSAGEA